MSVLRSRHLFSLAAALALTAGTTATAVAQDTAAALREVMFVGNNWTAPPTSSSPPATSPGSAVST